MRDEWVDASGGALPADLVLDDALLDQEHAGWLGVVQRFETAARDGEAHAIVYATLADVLLYTEQHFEKEEAYMASKGYPDLADHRYYHENMRQEMRRYASGDFTEQQIIDAFRTLLPNWVRYHIDTCDRRFAVWIKDRAAQPG